MTTATAAAEEEERELREYSDAVAQAKEERRIRDYVAAVEAAEEAKAEEERRILQYVAAVEAAEVREREAAEYRAALDRLVAAETAEAIRQGGALVQRMCGTRGGWYTYQISPVRVWLDRCNPGQSVGDSRNGGGSGGGDLDCEDYGYEFEIDPYDDPHGLDGDGDGIACEGW